MSFFKKLLILPIALFTITSVYAESYDDSYGDGETYEAYDDSYDDDASCEEEKEKDCSCCIKCQPEPACPVGCDVPREPETSGYNQKANINVCGAYDFFVTGTFLWFEAMQEQMELAIEANTTTKPGKVHDFNYDWKPAFKVGAGYNWNYDGWKTYIQYTRLSFSQSSTAIRNADHATMGQLWAAQLTSAQSVDRAKSRWKLNFNIIDAEKSRPFYSGQKLTFNMHVGLKGGWIRQRINFVARDANNVDYYANYKCDSWLIGPRGGIYSNWLLGNGFRFFGNGAASVFYQKFHKLTALEPEANNPSTLAHGHTWKLEKINGSIEGILGLGVGTYFDRNRWHFDLSVAYEAQLYFNQNMPRVIYMYNVDDENSLKPGNLMLHGLNVTARIDF